MQKKRVQAQVKKNCGLKIKKEETERVKLARGKRLVFLCMRRIGTKKSPDWPGEEMKKAFEPSGRFCLCLGQRKKGAKSVLVRVLFHGLTNDDNIHIPQCAAVWRVTNGSVFPEKLRLPEFARIFTEILL